MFPTESLEKGVILRAGRGPGLRCRATDRREFADSPRPLRRWTRRKDVRRSFAIRRRRPPLGIWNIMNDIFITENFLLQNDRAVELYHRFARDLPIIDYHCHLPPQQIAEDHRFANLAEIWLYGDHYKWRAMRSAGVAERYCTGDACDWEKFEKWAEVVPRTLRNPLYHWTHLELKRPLGISDRLLNPADRPGNLGSSATPCLPATTCRAAASCGR